jgi:xylan 1,4-beta-xylosidase
MKLHDRVYRDGDQGNGTFVNPILRGNYADPSVVRVGSDYYMVNTSCRYVPGLIVWHSRDLVNWRPISAALTEYAGDVWAPDIVFLDGTYYIYYPSNRTNWVITAEQPEGPWSKPIDLRVGGIDPGHVVGPDGVRYLHLSNGYMVQLTDDGLSVIGEPRKVYEPWKYPEDWEVEAFSPEGPKLTYRNGYYYMTVAVGGTAGPATSHMVACSRSVTPWGPWEHSPYNPIIHTESREERWWSQGHGSLIDTPDGSWWMVYHAYERGYHSLGRHTLLLPIEWTEDGWYRVCEGVSPEEPIPMPQGEKVQHGWAGEDDFAGDALGLHWQSFGAIDQDRLQACDGYLSVAGRNVESACIPLLYMPSDRRYEVEIEVELSGDVEARLLLFYNETAYFGVGASARGVRHFRTFKMYGYAPYEGNKTALRIRNDEHVVSFFYKSEGVWRKYDKVLEASGFHHNTLGGFLSLRAGIDVIGEGTAKFTHFRYRAI